LLVQLSAGQAIDDNDDKSSRSGSGVQRRPQDLSGDFWQNGIVPSNTRRSTNADIIRQNERIIVGRSTGSTAGRRRTLSAMTSWLIADYARRPRASVLKRYQLRETKVTATGRGKERKRETRKRQKEKIQWSRGVDTQPSSIIADSRLILAFHIAFLFIRVQFLSTIRFIAFTSRYALI